jgi:glutathione synthase/RimK-type ligase-like ATP-grasp enzyme
MGSRSASILAEGLRAEGHRCFKVYPNRNYRPRSTHLIVNWGCSNAPDWANYDQQVLNRWPNVANATNKLTCFEVLRDAGVSIPEFTTDETIALGWVRDKTTVVGRSILRGSGGEGIWLNTYENTFYPDGVVAFPIVPLYVKYIKKTEEYRIHVFRGQVIDIQQKRRRANVPNEEVNWQIRNLNNGFIFARSNIRPADSVLRESVDAVQALGLDFGAVDIIWNSRRKTAYVLEINTAPGLEGSTINSYVNALKEIL